MTGFPGIHGTTAVVTGATSGIGRAIARGLAESGASRVVAVTRSVTDDSEVAKDVRALGCDFIALQCDFASDIGRAMIARGGGKIVFTCSLAAFQGNVGVPSYTASKSASSSIHGQLIIDDGGWMVR